jgi:hypothetical protein
LAGRSASTSAATSATIASKSRLPPSSPLLLLQEKARLDEIKALQKKKEDLAIRLENAQNRLDLAMVADIK